MRKTILYSMAVLACAAATLSSCSSDDETQAVTPQTANAKEISFSPLANMLTRAVPTTTENYLTRISNFRVWSYYTKDGSDTYYMGAAGDNGLYVDGDGSGNWSHRTASELHYWPDGLSLNFFAVTPAENSGYVYDSDADTRLTYTVPAAHGDQVDLMVARAADQTASTNNGVVTLPFQHVLSQIAFAAKTKSSDLSVEIKGITVHNIVNSIEVNLKNGTTSEGAGYSNYAIGLTNAVTANSTTEAVSATDADGVLLLVPQSNNGWTAETSTSAADGQHECYLEIECKIKSGDGYILGDADNYGKTYVSFPFSWEASKKYVYTLIFGVGKTADGGTSSTPITFSVSVTDWNTDSGNNSDVNM